MKKHDGWVACKKSRIPSPHREVFRTRKEAKQWADDQHNPVGYDIMTLAEAWEQWARSESQRANLLAKIGNSFRELLQKHGLQEEINKATAEFWDKYLPEES
mgnify:CR=1 FL=1